MLRLLGFADDEVPLEVGVVGEFTGSAELCVPLRRVGVYDPCGLPQGVLLPELG